MPTLGTNTTTLNRLPARASTARQGKKKKRKESVRKDFTNFGELQQWLAPWGCTSGTQLTHSGSHEAREMPGLGTQALKPWGLKRQAADNDVLYHSLFSKPITEVGAQEKWLYHPCLSGSSPCLVSQSLRTQTGDAPRTAAIVMQKSNAVKKTLHLCWAVVSKEKDFDCLDQSVHILAYKTNLHKMLGALVLHNIHQKAG